MKLVLVASLVLAACGAPQPVRESPLVHEGSDTPESCCCKTTPLTSDDGKANYEMLGRMECSTRHGDCVLDVQCSKSTSSAPAN